MEKKKKKKKSRLKTQSTFHHNSFLGVNQKSPPAKNEPSTEQHGNHDTLRRIFFLAPA